MEITAENDINTTKGIVIFRLTGSLFPYSNVSRECCIGN